MATAVALLLSLLRAHQLSMSLQLHLARNATHASDAILPASLAQSRPVHRLPAVFFLHVISKHVSFGSDVPDAYCV